MFKKFAIAVPMTLLALSTSMAFAAEEVRSSINIKATIPTQVFHAQPVNPEFSKDETMAYNLAAGTLDPLRATYDVRHTNGSVGAYVEPAFVGLTDEIRIRFAGFGKGEVMPRGVQQRNSTSGDTT